MHNIHHLKEPPDFSLVLGGPLFQLLMRMHLTTPTLDLLKKRIFFITMLAWLPILLLSIIDGKAWSGAAIPFLYDFEVQLRFLLALPLLIAAELLVHKEVRELVGQFIERDIITEKMRPKFFEAIVSAMKLRNSVSFEVFLLFLVFIGGNYLWSSFSILETIEANSGTWFAVTNSSGSSLSYAGYYYVFFSRPLFQFIAFRWYFRIFIWARFLWQCSRLDLNLIPTHPDRACGIGFLSTSGHLFSPIVLAHGVLLAGLIANTIFYAGEKLSDHLLLIFGVILFLEFLVLGPLLVFSVKLMKAQRKGLHEYGILASDYVIEFDNKWIDGKAQESEQLIGNSDIQSLADLANSFQVIRDIRWYPFDKDTILHIIILTIIPVLPLVLTMVPLQQLLKLFFESIL